MIKDLPWKKILGNFFATTQLFSFRVVKATRHSFSRAGQHRVPFSPEEEGMLSSLAYGKDSFPQQPYLPVLPYVLNL